MMQLMLVFFGVESEVEVGEREGEETGQQEERVERDEQG